MTIKNVKVRKETKKCVTNLAAAGSALQLLLVLFHAVEYTLKDHHLCSTPIQDVSFQEPISSK